MASPGSPEATNAAFTARPPNRIGNAYNVGFNRGR